MQDQADTIDTPAEVVTPEANPEAAAPITVESAAPDTAASDPAPVIQDAVNDMVDAVNKAAEDIGTTPDAAVGSAETMDKLADSVETASGIAAVSPALTFFLGLGLLIMFVWYFATEIERRKRIIGSVLAVGVTALCVWFYSSLGMEKGIELQGGVSMEISIQQDREKQITPETQQQVIEVLAKRLNALGTGEVILAPSGETGIFLQIPGVGQEKLEEIKEILEKVAVLEFSILHPDSSSRAPRVANGAEVVPGYHALPFKVDAEEENPLPINLRRHGLVKLKPDMSGKYIKSANYVFGQEGPSVSVSFTGEGAKIMGPLTQENLKRPMAIIMDGEILSAPVIQSVLTDGCLISGSFTQEEAQALASALENPLENPISIEYSNYISPTMGAATVNQGISAGVAGLVMTLIFIVIYYRFAGLLALVGMCINIAIIFGTMALFRFTLTLPGIAGIILTIGVAIDANVLIYERLREELGAGKSLKGAIKAAYEKAFSAIIDANITTLITAIILYAVAAGTVKGFAITLIVGILASLFSALLVTRVCFGWATEAQFLKGLKFMNFVPEKTIDFLSRRKVCLIGSVIALIASLCIVPLMDPRGVELKGGDSITIHSTEGMSKDKIEAALDDIGLESKPLIQVQRPVGDPGEFYLIRSADGTADAVIAEIEKDLDVELKDTNVSSVGSAVGDAMLKSSAIALLIGLGAILIYVTFRFEFAFALGAIAALFHDLIVVGGITTLLGQEMSLITVGAFLTIAGYSINDTIVVFDRVREGLATKRGDVKDIINYSLNKTLARTLLTSVTTLLTVVVLYLFGGPGLRNFSLTLIIGVIIGTYSSIFIASPIVLWWARKSGTNLRREVLDTEQSKIDAMTTT